MNTKRLIVLGLAGVMAIAAALLARGMMGGGTPKVEAKAAPPVAMSEVLIANADLQPGQALSADQVRWEKWPAATVNSAFITRNSVAGIDDAVKGTVVRSPLMSGQPITRTAIVHGSASGFMAAMLTPGMRAVSISISVDSGAGGFILPNDRVDVILTRKYDGTPPRVISATILSDIRVLAVDQTFKQEKDTRTVIGKTATLELTPAQAQEVEAAQNAGTLSLSLRPLAESDTPVATNTSTDDKGPVAIIRYGVAHADSSGAPQGGRPQ